MYWEPGTQYNYDDVVEYEGHRYKIVQPHRSQSDWTPPITPALWGRLSDNDNNYGGDCKQQEQQQQGYQQQQPYHQQGQYQQDQYQQGQYQQGQYDQQPEKQQQTVEPSQPEEKKQWYEDEATRKKMEIGGGIAAGAALLAGGLFAYKKHEEHKEAAQSQAWAHGNWLSEAKERQARYNNGGTVHEAATWVLTSGKKIPQGAILVGTEKSWNLYICRAPHDGGLLLGKASEAFKNGAVLGHENKEVFVDEYEVLVGHMNRLRWVQTSGKLNVASLGYRPVEGGKDNKGSPLYIAEAPHDGAVHPGKASEQFEGAYIAYGGKEKHVREYRVLCYNERPNY